jgi:hypothetical protein
MTTILFGNVDPHAAIPGLTSGPPAVARRLDPLIHHTTSFVVPDDWPTEKVTAAARSMWQAHSSSAPGWITCEGVAENETLSALRETFNLPDIPGPTMLLVNSGRDFVASQLAGTPSATAIAKYVGLTANATAPGATDTTLTGEITTASGGLIRVAAAYSHTTGSATYTLTNTFTTNGFDTLPVTVAKAGVFDAATAGNLVWESLMVAAPLVDVGDSLPIIWTVSY